MMPEVIKGETIIALLNGDVSCWKVFRAGRNTELSNEKHQEEEKQNRKGRRKPF